MNACMDVDSCDAEMNVNSSMNSAWEYLDGWCMRMHERIMCVNTYMVSI